jgi:hypothetical protein
MCKCIFLTYNAAWENIDNKGGDITQFDASSPMEHKKGGLNPKARKKNFKKVFLSVVV